MKNIHAKNLKHKLEQDQVILVDVREPAEFRAEHIPGSYSIPLDKVSISNLPVNNKTIVFICKTGRRSSIVCEKFSNYYPNMEVYSLNGGISAWKEAGYDIITTSKFRIPLEQQIQLMAGTLVLFGVVVGSLVNSFFYLLSGFVGCGLIFSGLTGWCGMAKLLAMMPWNQ